MNLSPWKRAVLWATAAQNTLGAFAFVPAFGTIRAVLGLPTAVHPVYLWIIGEFIFIFGVAYGWCAQTARAPRLFLALGAAGKLAFVATLVGFWLMGELATIALLGGVGDLIFGCLFLRWLVQPNSALT